MKLPLLPLFQRVIMFTLFLSLFCTTRCYHYRVIAPESNPLNEYEAKTVHNLFWGMLQTRPVSPPSCASSNGLHDVRVTSNLGYSVLTVVTLGIWCPMKIEWRCARPCPRSAGDL